MLVPNTCPTGMATSTPQLDVHQIADQMFAILKSLGEFDEMGVRGIINGILRDRTRELFPDYLSSRGREHCVAQSLEQKTALSGNFDDYP